MRVLFAASEGLPFIKTGGLADVIGSLPKILKENGVDVRVVLPMYKKTAEKDRANFENVGSCEIHSGNIHTVATYYKTEADGIPYYFIEHAGYFERDTLYGYDDDGERFAFFDKAVLEMFRVVGWMPEVVHCHDWQTGMIPAVCKAHYPYDGEMQNLKFVYTIHNLLFQGIYPASRLWDYFGLPYEWYENGTLRFHDNCISYLKAGVVLSDKITTVSPTYSQEILTPYFGEKMEDVLRMRSGDLSGIVNGIDMDVWDPATDKTLTENYHVGNFKVGKAANKAALQRDLGLREDPDVLLIGLVSRLTPQKGMDMVINRLHDLMSGDVQFVVLGSGDKGIENALKGMEHQYRRRAVFYCGYNEALAHRIYAGSDLFLMPSAFEPCGISQLNAMRYGSLPLVRETGGLRDTVQPYNQYTGEGTGFSFANINADEMMGTVRLAMDTYYFHRDAWDQLVINAMNKDVSWNLSAVEYHNLYKQLV